MIYTEYLPHPLLRTYIDKYWTIKGKATEGQHFFVAVDGCVDIIFTAGQSAQMRSVKEWHPYIVGAMSTYICIEVPHSNEMDMLGIRFKPAAITAFIRTPIYEMTDNTVDINYIDSILKDDFYLPLQENLSLAQRLEHINHYFINKLSIAYTQEERVLFAIKHIEEGRGMISSKKIAEAACLSPRQLERLFKSSTGLSPKTFSRVARYLYAKQYVELNPGESLFDIAVDCGYYDHSHLIKEFLVLGGNSPR